ncbi:MAG: transglutaminase domain-containing protein [Xanthomonadales bacterium]|nr:transglutaminase domain-containing protein [Xanthomonadales bacterium]
MNKTITMNGATRHPIRTSQRMRWRMAIPTVLACVGAGVLASEPLPSHEQAQHQVESMLVASPYRIPPTALHGRIRYRFEMDADRAWSWPTTGEQAVTNTPTGVVLTICAACGEEPVPDAQTLRRYRSPNHWIDSDARAVIRFSRMHAGGGRVDVRMRRLVDAVQRHMDGAIDYRAYATASEALASRSGDCTEFAVLLAATARAAGIPSRLAYGIAYSSRFTGRAHVFSPHVWVQAWDGHRWTSYDAGFGRFDAGHIALFVGDGSIHGLEDVSRAIMALRLVEAAEVRTASPASQKRR